MNIKKIQELVELMNSNDLGEVEIEEEGLKIKLRKTSAGVVHEVIPQVASAASAAPAKAAPEAAGAPEEAGNLKEITSPMVGTFYRAPSPDAEPYAEVGDTVHKGDVVCIIEAMKIMNEVKSEVDGKVVQIPVENAQAVEFGQALFFVEPL